MKCRWIITETGIDGAYTRRCERSAKGREGYCRQHLAIYQRQLDGRIGAYIRQRNPLAWDRYRKRLDCAP